MNGQIGILNVGAGDTKLVFDPTNPMECARSARIVRDMLKRGYVLFVKVGEKHQRALDFDEAHCEYIIADLDAPPIAKDEDNGEQGGTETGAEGAAKDAPPRPRRGRPSKRVEAGKVQAIAVPRSAGG